MTVKIEIEKENYEIILLNRLHARAQLGGVFEEHLYFSMLRNWHNHYG